MHRLTAHTYIRQDINHSRDGLLERRLAGEVRAGRAHTAGRHEPAAVAAAARTAPPRVPRGLSEAARRGLIGHLDERTPPSHEKSTAGEPVVVGCGARHEWFEAAVAFAALYPAVTASTWAIAPSVKAPARLADGTYVERIKRAHETCDMRDVGSQKRSSRTSITTTRSSHQGSRRANSS